MATQINETGVKGFLKWLAIEQPGLYQKIAPKVAANVPRAFDGYHAGMWKVAGLGASDALQQVSLDPSLVTAPTVDVSDAADAGATSTSVTDWISNIVKGVSSLYLTKKQADIQQQVVNTQLQRAAAGLPPLSTSLANLGVPQVNVGLQGSTGTMLLVGGGIIAAIFVLPKLLSALGGRSRR